MPGIGDAYVSGDPNFDAITFTHSYLVAIAYPHLDSGDINPHKHIVRHYQYGQRSGGSAGSRLCAA